MQGVSGPVSGVRFSLRGRRTQPPWSSVLAHRVTAPLGLVLLAAVVYAPHAVTGGFNSDDWSYEADARIPRSFDAVFSWLAPRTNHGELHAAYQIGVHRLFAPSMSLHMVWLATLAGGSAVMFYCLLRELGVARAGATWMAAGAMLMPLVAATRLWVTAGAGSLAVLLALVGAWCALRGLRQQGRRGVFLHVAALVCYATSMLTYELTGPAIALSLLLYLRVAAWRRALVPWLADACLAIVVVIHVASLTTLPTLPVSAQLDHALTIARQAAKAILAAGFIPAAGSLRYAVVASSVVVLLLLLALANRSKSRRRIRRSYEVIGAGVVVVAIAYSVLVPSVYDPLTPGLELRVNAVAVFGYTLTFYGVGRLALATLPTRMPFGVTPTVLVSVVGCLVIAAYIAKTEVDTAHYAKPRREEQARIANLTRSLNACYERQPTVLRDGACGGLVTSWLNGP